MVLGQAITYNIEEDNNMLISIMGGQGTGKTTVLNELMRAGYQVIERKTSRSILSDWGVTLSEVNNNHELTIKFQDEILLRKYQDELIGLSSNTVYLTERTYADLFVYALVALGKDNEYTDWLNSYYNKCVQLQAAYDRVFYLQAGHFQPVNDGVRGINQHYSTMVDLVMLHYTSLMTPSLNLCIIDTPYIDERVSIIATEITQIKTDKNH